MSHHPAAPAEDADLRALGRIALAFSQLDAALQIGPWQLLGLDRWRGQLVTSQLGVRQRPTLVVHRYGQHSRAGRRGPEDAELEVALAPVVSFAKLARAAASARNTAAHATWILPSTERGRARRVTFTAHDDRWRFSSDHMTPTEID
jgi:hypothetical protein